MFDAHNHIQFPAYDADRGEVLARAKETGVKMIAVGTQISSSKAAIELAEKYPGEIWAAVGFHPNHAVGADWYHDKNEQREAVPEVFDIDKMRELARHPSVVAIGECGLDYFRLGANREAQIVSQKEIFIAQIELAQELGKPLMIHCRASKGTDDAYEDALQILLSLRAERSNLTNILHFYAGSLNVTKKFVEFGYYFTFGGVITFSRDYDEVVKYIPLERIMLETDAPYVAPEPHRGEKNEPAYVIEVAKRLAELKGISVDDIISATNKNILTVFKISV